MKRPAPAIALNSSNKRSHVNTIVYYVLNIFVQDCKDLIVAGIQTSINRQIDNPDINIHEKGLLRKHNLATWLKTIYPLAWGWTLAMQPQHMLSLSAYYWGIQNQKIICNMQQNVSAILNCQQNCENGNI